MGAPGLDDAGELVGLALQRRCEVAEGGNQVGEYGTVAAMWIDDG